MWGKYALERKLADLMGYEYCTLFDSARSAMQAYGALPYLPSNVCPILGELFPRAKRVPVRPDTGLSSAPFQLYGYRQEFKFTHLEIDPLMTGFRRKPNAMNCIISFGRKKMLNNDGGGAWLSEEPIRRKSYFPKDLRDGLAVELRYFAYLIAKRWDQIDEWDRHLGDSCIRIPQEQIMPWRVMRRIAGGKRDMVVRALREAGHAVGTNYPPLPGVTDAGAIQWGNEVINFFPDDHDIHGACAIIKGVVG